MDSICSESTGARKYEISSLQATMYYYVPLSVLAAVLCDASNRFLAFSAHYYYDSEDVWMPYGSLSSQSGASNVTQATLRLTTL